MVYRQKLPVIIAALCVVFSCALNASNPSNDEPIILESPNSMSQCIGGSEKLKIILNEGVKASIQWQISKDNKVWENVNGATGVEFTPDSKEIKSTWYRVAVVTEGKDSRISLSNVAEVKVAKCEASNN